jgi:sortase A
MYIPRLGFTWNKPVRRHRDGDSVDFPQLRRGGAVLPTDGTTWFTYRIDKGPYKTVPSGI